MQTTKRSPLICLTWALALLVPCVAVQALTEQEAVSILVGTVIVPPTLDHDLIAFTLHVPLQSGDEVRPFLGGTTTAITQPTWFFWIDDEPKSKFTHATRFVFIDDATAAVIVQNEEWFPVLNGASLWRNRSEYWDESNWAYSRIKDTYKWNPGPGVRAMSPEGLLRRLSAAIGRKTLDGPQNCGVVVNGTDEKFMQEDKEHMEDSFSADGYEVYNVGPDTGNSSDDFEEAVDDAVATGCTNVTIYVSSHGGHTPSGEDYFVLGDEEYTESDLKSLLDFYSTMNPGVTFKFIFDFCHCGSFRDTMNACANAVFWHFACGADELSYSAQPDYHNADCTNFDPNGPGEYPGSESTTGFWEDLEKIRKSAGLRAKLAALAAQYGIHSNVVKYLFAEITSMRKDETALKGETHPLSEARISSTHIVGTSPARVDEGTAETYAIWNYQVHIAPDSLPATTLVLQTLPGQYLWAEGTVMQSPATLNRIQTQGTEAPFPPGWQGFYDPGGGMIVIQTAGMPWIPLVPGGRYQFSFRTMSMELGFIPYQMLGMDGLVIPGGQGETFGPMEFVTPPAMMIGAMSRKTHGSAGPMDVSLTLDPPAAASVECRAEGPTQVLLTFSEPVMALDGIPDGTEVTLSAGVLISVSIVDNEMAIDLAHVPPAPCLAIAFNGIVDSFGHPVVGDNDVHVRVLYGDRTGDGVVNIVDLNTAKQDLFKPVGSSTFRSDVNADGVVNIVDLNDIKRNLFHTATCP